MIKVRHLTGIGAAALTLPVAAGCAVDQQDDVQAGSQEANEAVAGSGALTLHSYSVSYGSTSGGDEFIRVDEKLKAAISFFDVLNSLYVGDAGDREAVDAIQADHTKVQVSAKVTYTKFDGSKFDAPLLPLTFAPGAGGVEAGTTAEFIVPKGVKALKLEFIASYEKNGAKTTRELLSTHGVRGEFVVFGAFAPDKLALFDTAGSDRRTRIVEGGGVVKGAHLVLSVTDWRLDTVVDKTSLDLRVGRKNSYSRFGSGVVDAMGQLEYAVSAVYSTDGGATFQGTDLKKISGPEVLSRNESWRFAFQELLGIPQNAGPNMKVAFHVQAYLVVPSYSQGEIFDARYQPGQRVLLKDVWDNNGGANYSLPIVSP